MSLVVLMVTVYALRPLDFGVFPTVLLVATLLRLALNVASTRVVLLNGHTGTGSAGKVIESFGEFVVGGNYAVGNTDGIVVLSGSTVNHNAAYSNDDDGIYASCPTNIIGNTAYDNTGMDVRLFGAGCVTIDNIP